MPTFTDPHGVRIHYSAWRVPEPNAIVQLAHGIGEHRGRYRALVEALNAAGYSVWADDHRGHGETGFEQHGGDLNRMGRPGPGGMRAAIEGVGRFTEVIGLRTYALYVFDYGAPTGFRVAMAHPERVTAIVSQNGNAYEEGLSEGWNPIQRYWRDRSDANRQALRELLTPASIRWQYEHGVPDTSLVSPDGSALDAWYIQRPGIDEIQLDLFGDYASNVALRESWRSSRGAASAGI